MSLPKLTKEDIYQLRRHWEEHKDVTSWDNWEERLSAVREQAPLVYAAYLSVQLAAFSMSSALDAIDEDCFPDEDAF